MLSFAVLGSGSSGNCTMVRRDGAAPILVDCGFSPRETEARLGGLGLGLDDCGAVLLTHLDCDHFHGGWAKAVETLGLRVYVHERHRRAALRRGLGVRWLRTFRDSLGLPGGTHVQGTLLAHDRLGTVGYVIEHRGARLGLATDLGRVPELLYRAFVDLHALALESNYEPALERGSDRPPFLKRRVMGGLGHLSNEQALRAVLRIAGRSPLSHVALLHLSRDCNDPGLVRRLYERRAPALGRRLTIAGQHEPTGWLDVRAPARQMTLF